MNTKLIEWVLRISVAGEFVGHGAFASGFLIPQKQQWVGWVVEMLGISNGAAAQLLFWVGLVDFLVALIVLFRPVKIALLYAVLWGFWTALLRPLVGEPMWDFVERWANWGAPLALLLLYGWPKSFKGWFTEKTL